MERTGPRPAHAYVVRGFPLAVLLALVAVACHGGAHEVFTVNTFVDGVDATPGDDVCEMTTGVGDCSLRAAIGEANADPTANVLIHLPTGRYTLYGAAGDDGNVSGDLDVTSRVTLHPLGAGVIIDGGLNDRVFDVIGGLDLHDLSVTGGNTADNGGGVQVRSGGVLRVVNSTLWGNTASTGGAIDNAGTTTMVLSTISGNSATSSVGGVNNTGTFTASSVTITANNGDGIWNNNVVRIDSTIVADQLAGAGDCSGFLITSEGYNLDSDGNCLVNPTVGDVVAGNAFLAPLADRGGFGPTHVPHATSDATDADDPTTFWPRDQRQVARPVGAGPDIGATEATALELAGPIAVDDSGAGFTTDENTTFTTGSLLTNDSDSLDPVTLTGVATGGTLGTVTANGDGTVQYNPNGAFEGLQAGDVAYDSFTYAIVDGDGLTATATVTIGIAGVNDGPSGVNDSATGTVGNTLAVLGTPNPGPGPAATLTGNVLLANDTDPDDPSASLVASNPVSGTGATITLNADGSFVYLPALGLSGVNDTFTYTVTDPHGLSATATATVTIAAERVWYVDNDNVGAHNGSSVDPFTSLASLQGAGDPDGTNDTIFVHDDDGTFNGLNGGFVMETGQDLIGEGVGLTFTAPIGQIVAPGGRPRLSNTNVGADTITLADSSRVAGLTIFTSTGRGMVATGRGAGSVINGVDITNSAGIGLDLATNTGTFVLDDVDISTTNGVGLRLVSTGTVMANGASNTISTNNRAAFTASGTALSMQLATVTSATSTSGGVDLSAVTGLLNIGSTTATGVMSGAGIRVASSPGFSGSFGDTTVARAAGAGAGIDLASNAGAAIAFTPLRNLTNDNGTGFKAAGGGTVNITGSPGISATGGPAVDITSVSASSSWVFGGLSSINSTADGVHLDGLSQNFTAGPVNVNAMAGQGVEVRNGTAASSVSMPSGLTVTNPGDDGVLLTANAGSFSVQDGLLTSSVTSDDNGVSITDNPGAVSLNGRAGARLTIAGFARGTAAGVARHGIVHSGSGNLTLDHVRINSIGNANGGDIGAEHGVSVVQPRSNSTITINNSAIDTLLDGDGDAISLVNDIGIASPVAGTGTLTFNFTGNTLDGDSGAYATTQAGLALQFHGGARIVVNAQTNTFTDLFAPVVAKVDGAIGSGGTPATITINGSTISNVGSDAIAIEMGDPSDVGDTYLDTVLSNNAIDGGFSIHAGPFASQGISLRTNGTGRFRPTVSGNTVRDVKDEALLFLSPDGSMGDTYLGITSNSFERSLVHVRQRGQGRLVATVTSNVFSGGAAEGLWVRDEGTAAWAVCADIRDNANTTNGTEYIRVSRTAGSLFYIAGLAGASNGAATAAYLASVNSGATHTTADDAGGVFLTTFTCSGF